MGPSVGIGKGREDVFDVEVEDEELGIVELVVLTEDVMLADDVILADDVMLTDDVMLADDVTVELAEPPPVLVDESAVELAIPEELTEGIETELSELVALVEEAIDDALVDMKVELVEAVELSDEDGKEVVAIVKLVNAPELPEGEDEADDDTGEVDDGTTVRVGVKLVNAPESVDETLTDVLETTFVEEGCELDEAELSMVELGASVTDGDDDAIVDDDDVDVDIDEDVKIGGAGDGNDEDEEGVLWVVGLAEDVEEAIEEELAEETTGVLLDTGGVDEVKTLEAVDEAVEEIFDEDVVEIVEVVEVVEVLVDELDGVIEDELDGVTEVELEDELELLDEELEIDELVEDEDDDGECELEDELVEVLDGVEAVLLLDDCELDSGATGVGRGVLGASPGIATAGVVSPTRSCGVGRASAAMASAQMNQRLKSILESQQHTSERMSDGEPQKRLTPR